MSSRHPGFAAFVIVLAGGAAAAAQPGPPRVGPGSVVDLSSLPVWPGHVEGGEVQVHAADVDGEVLRAMLATRGAAWVAAPVAKQVSGRVAVTKRAAALAALTAAEPVLATRTPRWRGAGVTIDLDFRAAGTADLFRLFADLLRVNVVDLTPSAQVTLRVRRAPAVGVMAEVAAVAGFALDRPAPRLIVVRPTTRGRVVKAMLSRRGAALGLRARGIAAGQLVALVRALDGPRSTAELLRDASLFCGGGNVIDLRLTKVPTSTAVDLIALAGDLNLRGPACGLSRLAPDVDPRQLTLLATVTRGRRRLAAVQLGRTVAYLDHDDAAWDVGDGFATHVDPTGELSLQLAGPATAWGEAPGITASTVIRLAATFVDDAGSAAVVEVDGAYRVWTSQRPLLVDDLGGVATIEIAPGEVRITGALHKTLRLQAR